MRYFFLIATLTVLVSIAGTKVVVTKQLNKIKILDQRIIKIESKIEKLKTEYSYLTSPQNLKKIKKENGLKLIPIEEENIIKLKN
ncbi:MAG: hypothetical protein CNE97_04485 [alpha proteobacterium MED-G10]|nr:MAG: hypothetical protein CNE97_04485 [alpha proteobacterium MED-G10]